MRIIVYGFGPYRRYRDNVSEKILRAWPRQRGLKKIVFPVRFNKSQFTDAVQSFRPDAVLGLGQCSRGRLLRMETSAKNRRRDGGDVNPRPIVRGGAPKLFPDLRLSLRGHGRLSRDAGDYVCNYSMYVILDFIKRQRLPVRFGFIHVPRRYDAEKALRTLRRAVLDSRMMKPWRRERI